MKRDINLMTSFCSRALVLGLIAAYRQLTARKRGFALLKKLPQKMKKKKQKFKSKNT